MAKKRGTGGSSSSAAVVTNFVDLVSSSDDDDESPTPLPPAHQSKPANPRDQPLPIITSSQNQNQNGEGGDSRSFWKAGNYDIGPSSFTSSSQGHLEHSRVHPKFLHSNATSHKWAFGAIAELLDNAVDEISNGATFVKVDKVDVMKDNSPALMFQDDGGGMDPDGLRKCMSLGYSSKKSNTTIGQYGNGFKTSTMRLGPDVIVFTRATRGGKATQSIGLLSYNFLRKTEQDDVIVPMVDFDISNPWAEPIIYSSLDDWTSNLQSILEWSPFASKEELLLQFEDIGCHGTKIIIYNLWLNDEGIYELSFDDDDEDIRLRDETNQAGLRKLNQKMVEFQSHISNCMRYSLRAYTSMLYLRKFKNFKIILRGKTVEQYNIADELQHWELVYYKPHLPTADKEISVETKIGFIKEAPRLPISGFNVYHKNRLIRPFWKVKTEGNSKGNGVVGVLEANFIEPAHDKQDFERSSLYIRLESKLKQILSEYWNKHCQLVGYQDPKLKKMSAKPSVRLSSEFQKHFPVRHLNAVTVDIPTSINTEEPIVVLAAGSLPVQNGSRVNFRAETLTGNILRHAESIEDATSVDSSVFTSVDQICDDNIQLFMRCEEHKSKEGQLKKTIEELERELELAKQKCIQLAEHVEKQKQQLLREQTRNV